MMLGRFTFCLRSFWKESLLTAKCFEGEYTHSYNTNFHWFGINWVINRACKNSNFYVICAAHRIILWSLYGTCQLMCLSTVKSIHYKTQAMGMNPSKENLSIWSFHRLWHWIHTGWPRLDSRPVSLALPRRDELCSLGCSPSFILLIKKPTPRCCSTTAKN